MTTEEIKSIFDTGKMQADVEHIKESITRIEKIMESSFARGGERMGKLEDSYNVLDKKFVAHEELDKAVAESVKDLKDGRKWVIGTFITIALTYIWEKVKGH